MIEGDRTKFLRHDVPYALTQMVKAGERLPQKKCNIVAKFYFMGVEISQTKQCPDLADDRHN